MRILKAILIASLSMPALIFLIFFVTGIVFLVADVIDKGEYSNGWLGLVYAGSVYAYFAMLLSTIPTIVLGLPMSLIAKKYGVLNQKVIFIGAAVAGGVFLAISTILYFEAADIELFLWALLVGSAGGLLNGYVFHKNSKPNKRPQFDAAPPRA